MLQLYLIGRSRFRADLGELTDGSGHTIELRPKTGAVLTHLASSADRVVTRDELLEAIWPGVHVTENSLSQCIAEVRRALGQDKAALRTLPGRGYVLDATAAMPVFTAAPIRSPIPMLAALPFSVGAPDDKLESFAHILHDCLVGALCALREPMVISANSTRKFDASADNGPSFGQRLGAQYVVTGRLHRVGKRIHLSIELVGTAGDTVLWQHGCDLSDKSLFQVPYDLASIIANTIVPHIKATELREARRRRHDASAYQLVLDAQSLMYPLEPTGFQMAKQLLEKAATLDPGFAMPHAVLGNWYSLSIGQSWSNDKVGDMRALEKELRLALQLDPGNSRALALLGHSHSILLRQYDIGLELLDRSLESAPNDAETCMWASPTLAYVGRTEDAVRNAERAIQLSPADPLMFRYQHFLSIAHYCRGDYQRAAYSGLRSLRLNSEYTSNLLGTTAALGALGRVEDARPIANRLMRLLPKYRASESTFAVADREMLKRYIGHLVAAGVPR